MELATLTDRAKNCGQFGKRLRSNRECNAIIITKTTTTTDTRTPQNLGLSSTYQL